MRRSNIQQIVKTVFVGILVAVLIYWFHPGVGHMNLMINGDPVAEPLAPFAAMTALLLVLGMTVILGLLMFFGVGLLIFLGVLFFGVFGIILVAPYFWPMLIIIFLVIGLMSIGNNHNH
jgi:hypothetical protein